MKKSYKKLLTLAFSAFTGIAGAFAQCPTITCPANISVNNDPSSCGAVVNFTPPVGTNPCAVTTQTFNYSGSIVNWTVPAGVTSIHIIAKGAQGGYNTNSGVMSGLGATMSGDFTVTPGQVLKILVGEQPSLTTGTGNGGGGGTFVTDNSNNPLIVAGGGGGSASTTDSPNKNGQTGTTGGTGAAGGGTGGTAGSGGSVGSSGFQSGAGGGLLTNGADGWTSGTGGSAFVNGGAGGPTNAPARGGFGGGGSGSSYVVGGGGGGYSGGGSGGNSTAGVGGGGGSYNAGTNQANTGGNNSGHGSVVISYTNSSTVTTTQTAGLASGSNFPIGTTTQTFLVDDGLGNQSSCSFLITVADNENPVITAPANITVNNDPGTCGAVVTYTAPVGTDNCSGVTTALTSGIGSGGTFPIGTTTETYTATDASGNTASASFTVTVIDNENPIISPVSNITVNNDPGMCSAVVTYTPPVGTDNCSGATITLTSGIGSGGTFPTGVSTETYTITDGSGNTASTSFTITVNDNEAPVITCPGTITVNNDASMCSAVVNYTPPVGTDNCSGATTVLLSGLGSGGTFPVGTNTEVYKCTDAAGNFSTCQFDVVVVDAEAPSISCGGDVQSCTSAITGIGPITLDNCSGTAITYTLTGATTGTGSNDASGTFNVGVTHVMYVAMDMGGNSDTCTMDVTVFAPPTITASASSTNVCVDDADVILTATPVGGSWSGTGVTGSSFDPSVGAGTHTVTYTFTDSNGCTGSFDIVITVNACTGVDEHNALNAISFYPNPNNGAFTVVSNGNSDYLLLEVVDLSGRVVYSSEEHGVKAGFTKNILLDNIASGVYMLRLTNEEGQRMDKISIQK
jgi:hypothetical protein